jgi:hypothetical protein
MSRLPTHLSAPLLATLLVTACGGGGSDSPELPPPPSASFDIAAAVTGIATGNETFVLAGTIAGEAAVLQATHTALADAPLSSYGTLNRFRRTAAITAAGATTTAFEDDYVDLSTRTFYGLIDSAGSQALSTARTPYPVSALIGAAGSLYVATTYDADAVPIGTIRVTWSLEAVTGDANSAYLCVNTDFGDPFGVSTGDRENDCYRISTSGQRLGMRITFVSPAFGTAVFQ